MTEPRDGIGRRDFLGGGVAAAALGAAARAGARPIQEGETRAAAPAFILDSHNHCGGTEAWVREMVEVYRPRNAMACVNTWIRDLELMVDAVRSHPDVFIGYGRVRPDDPTAVRQIETFKKKGFRGIKFHSPRENWDDPSYFQAYRLCEEYGMVMLLHTGISSRREFENPTWGSSSRMRPMYLDTLCRQFPRTVIQGAHLGNPWYEEAAEAAPLEPQPLLRRHGLDSAEAHQAGPSREAERGPLVVGRGGRGQPPHAEGRPRCLGAHRLRDRRRTGWSRVQHRALPEDARRQPRPRVGAAAHCGVSPWPRCWASIPGLASLAPDPRNPFDTRVSGLLPNASSSVVVYGRRSIGAASTGA